MKVILFNGSPHKTGCTYTALVEIAEVLGQEGVDTEIFQVGTEALRGCMGCGRCRELGKCIFEDGRVNEAIEKAKKADGFIFGSPVHYAAASGSMTSFMDRMFYAGKGAFTYKPAASIVSARRGGTTAAYDQLNKYIGISNMIMVPAPYWNMVHGNTPDEVKQDKEGLRIMRMLGKNMAWILNLIENGKVQGISFPEQEPAEHTNFIR